MRGVVWRGLRGLLSGESQGRMVIFQRGMVTFSYKKRSETASVQPENVNWSLTPNIRFVGYGITLPGSPDFSTALFKSPSARAICVNFCR